MGENINFIASFRTERETALNEFPIEMVNSETSTGLAPHAGKLFSFNGPLEVPNLKRCTDVEFLCLQVNTTRFSTFRDPDLSNNLVCKQLIPHHYGGVGDLQCPYGKFY